MNKQIVDTVVRIISESSGYPYKMIESEISVFYNQIDSTLEVIHPPLNDSRNQVSMILKMAVRNPGKELENIIKEYTKFVYACSPNVSNSKLAELVKKNGMNFIMFNDNYLQLAFGQNIILNMVKVQNPLEAGYRISFNPSTLKYYRSDVKDDIMKFMLTPPIKMYSNAIRMYSPLFFKQDEEYESIIKKIILLIEASFNKKKYNNILEIERDNKFSLIIEVKQLFGSNKKMITVQNVDSIKYKGKKIKAVNNTITL